MICITLVVPDSSQIQFDGMDDIEQKHESLLDFEW